jgi:hypothetical protein
VAEEVPEREDLAQGVDRRRPQHGRANFGISRPMSSRRI